MHQLVNNTPFRADTSALVDSNGNQFWVVVVKATYALSAGGEVDVHADQEAVCTSPVYAGEPGRSSLLRDAEIVCAHPGTDVSVLGTAYAPRGTVVHALSAAVSVAHVAKTVRVFGRRLWNDAFLRLAMTAPEEFTEMPISYESAFGGSAVLPDGVESVDRRNPIGRGFAARRKDVAGQPLPNIEDPDHLIRHWDDRPPVAGLGPIPPMWSPRLEYAGTFDEAWRTKRMPLLPADYDQRFTQAAPPDLVAADPLTGGETMVLTNLTRDEPRYTFRLPRARLTVRTLTRWSWLSQTIQLDRIIVEPDAMKLVMVWRSSLNCGPYVRDIRLSIVDVKPRLDLRTRPARG